MRGGSRVALLSMTGSIFSPRYAPFQTLVMGLGPDLAVGFGRSRLLSRYLPEGHMVVLNFFLPHRDVVRL